MADAKQNTRTETIVNEVPDGVTLTLTQDEAQFLRTLVGGHVTGGGRNRQLNNAIYNAIFPYTEDKGMFPTNGNCFLRLAHDD